MVWLATGGMELGAVSMMIYGWREREEVLRFFQEVTGLRMNHNYIRPGGVAVDLPPGWRGDVESILDEKRAFRFIPGPVFANIILADEINRTPPKTQAALLEAMQEKAITVAGKNYPLEEPFFVLATQNPIEQEGTYPLPEAQLDRFMFNIWLDYPSFKEEVQVVKNTTFKAMAEPREVVSAQEILYFQDLVRKIPVPDNVYEYAVKLAAMTRPGTSDAHKLAGEYLNWGAGPRASQYMILGAKCHAAIHGKYSPDIENVNAVALSVLRHRIVRNYKAEAEGMSVEKIIQELTNK